MHVLCVLLQVCYLIWRSFCFDRKVKFWKESLHGQYTAARSEFCVHYVSIFLCRLCEKQLSGCCSEKGIYMENKKKHKRIIQAALTSQHSHAYCIMQKKRNLSASRMRLNHSSLNGMRMQLAWWDIVDTWTNLRSKGKSWATWGGLRDWLSVIVMSWVVCKRTETREQGETGRKVEDLQ